MRPRCFLRAARASRLAALLLAACWLPAAAQQAGETGASFRITMQVIAEAPGTCSASTQLGAPQLTCRPSVVGPASAAQAGDPRHSGGAVYVRSEAPVRLAGEMVEVGTENHYAWLEDNTVAWSERSSRRVAAGGHEYVEMMFAW